ncbi:MAG: hypothetical protein K8T26_04080 [Lentisphaerae bacterium]|nr:hypothetical protein [Lentisphaerota bacterium]
MKAIQYSVRGIDERTDALLRKQARETGLSLNQATLEALRRGLGIDQEPHRHGDLDDLAGTWIPDPETDQALREMDQVDEDLWI